MGELPIARYLPALGNITRERHVYTSVSRAGFVNAISVIQTSLRTWYVHVAEGHWNTNF